MNINKTKEGQIFIIVWMVLFVFQSLLSNLSSIFSYIDEAPLIFFLIISGIKVISKNKITIKKKNCMCIFAIILFILAGLAGNVMYRYQPWKLVAVDLITNLKFFGAIGFFLMHIDENSLDNKRIFTVIKIITITITFVFLVDRVINIFPSEYRYGIKSAKLFYEHPTYLAGICAFLIALMTMYDSNKFALYILMNITILAFTLRSKAIVSVVVYIMLYMIIKKLKCKLKVWQIIIVGIVAIICAWSQIYFYFINLGGQSARSVMLTTSFKIVKDYFPIGTGFGTYASHSAAVQYSPVYLKYGFELIYELRNSTVGTYFDDQFWPIILGQTGIIGIICYCYILIYLFKKIQRLYKIDLDLYMSGLFIFIYLLISSIAEPAFNNSVAIPLAMVIAMIMKKANLKLKKANFL